MLILAMSTSTPRGSVAVVREGEPVVESGYVDLQGHAERLFQAIDEALARAGATRAAIGALACDVGPGSFTGVRVGVASAKGIALGLGVPLVGVVSLEAMAAAAIDGDVVGDGDVVLAALDAKKGEVFLAAWHANGQRLLDPMARPLGPEAFALEGVPPERVVVVGEVARGIAPPAGVRLATGPALDLPDAAWIGKLALPRVAAGEGRDPAPLEPLYVRAPDAMPMPAV